MAHKKRKQKLSLQKIKITKLNRNNFSVIKGGDTEIPIDFSNSLCHTDTCPTDQQSDNCASLAKNNGCSGTCRTNNRQCGLI
ncbi:hypothetical protein [Aquimarina algiphila]|uniref:hypothetical protein n=1 Tax=Aquimarina algiphila TaxID=2047982 RepID=UPI0023315664|nr:hypothetical protein [Aquimarina algiphila]